MSQLTGLPGLAGSRIFLTLGVLCSRARCISGAARVILAPWLATSSRLRFCGSGGAVDLSHVSGEDAAREARSEALTPSRSP